MIFWWYSGFVIPAKSKKKRFFSFEVAHADSFLTIFNVCPKMATFSAFINFLKNYWISIKAININ